jgi:crossover junction endodeoxyribonuclease RuvC
VRRSAGDNQLVDVGAITTAASTAAPERLQELHRGLTALIDRHRPESAAVEQLFFGSNTTTAMRVGEARGVILLALQQCGVETWEYTPAQVKTSLTGYGKADKAQVTKMVRAVLELPDGLGDDAFDAVAIALCHLQSRRMLPGRKIS